MYYFLFCFDFEVDVAYCVKIKKRNFFLTRYLMHQNYRYILCIQTDTYLYTKLNVLRN